MPEKWYPFVAGLAVIADPAEDGVLAGKRVMFLAIIAVLLVLAGLDAFTGIPTYTETIKYVLVAFAGYIIGVGDMHSYQKMKEESA